MLLTTAFTLFAWTLPVSAEQKHAPTPNTEDRSDMPQMSDFTSPYTCPWFFNRPASCNTPIKIAVECVDLRTINPKKLTRPLTEVEMSNGEKTCELLPQWLDKDPRIKIVGDNRMSDIILRYEFSASGRSFVSLGVFVSNANFEVNKPFQEPYDTAAYFVEQSLLELGNRGYLP